MMSLRHVVPILVFLSASLAHAQEDAGPPPPDAGPVPLVVAPASQPSRDCLRFARDADDVARRIGATTLGVGDQPVVLGEVRFLGLGQISEAQLWQLVGGRPAGTLDLEQAAVLVARLAESGLFASVKPAIWLGQAQGGQAVLEIRVVENPRLSTLRVTGLDEITEAEILDVFFRLPGSDGDAVPEGCPTPTPPEGWLARLDGGRLRPGVIYGGVEAGLERIQEMLDDEGFLLARVTATLGADGVLTIAVDEGRLDAVDLRGVHPALRDEVAARLGVRAGRVFNLDDLRLGLAAVERRYPFLSADRRPLPARPGHKLVKNTLPDGGAGYLFVDGAPTCKARLGLVHDDLPPGVLELVGEIADEDEKPCPARREWYQLEGRTLIVHLESERFRFDGEWLELVRHTQATSFAPGLGISLRVFDAADRAHFRLDTLFNLNVGRDGHDAEDDGALAELAAAESVDLLVSPSLSLPGIGLAELGVAGYTLTDSDDGWRVSDLDSYLNSMLWDEPGREHYRRTGVSAFATFMWFDQVILGAEYRHDRHDSLGIADGGDTIFEGEIEEPNPPIDDGVFGSLLLRAEWSSEAIERSQLRLGGRRRPVQGSIVDYPVGAAVSALRTVATLEVADEALGGDAHFWRAVSDSVLSLQTGDDQGVALRLRVGGGEDLPLQRQEALGGWGSLRGHGFKELRGGDASVLGSLEYRFEILGLFADLGAVRVEDEWVGPKLGVGAALLLGDSGQLAFAWRTDDEAEAEPEIRLVFGRPW